MTYRIPGPWHGQQVGTGACLHFGAVQVESIVTGEPLSRWCPSCGATQYDWSIEEDDE